MAGAEFSADVVAAAVNTNIVTIEERCEALVQRQAFLRRTGIAEWPDGTPTARYGFQHALQQQQLWHEQVTPMRRQQWHRRIGELEAAYDGQTGESAAELALHFEQGRDYPRAVRYLQAADAPSDSMRPRRRCNISWGSGSCSRISQRRRSGCDKSSIFSSPLAGC